MKYHDKKIVEYAKSVRLKLKEQSKKEDFISSPVEFNKFMEKEKLSKAGIFAEMKIINQMARDIIGGKREIQFDLDKLDPDQRIKAKTILNRIKIHTNRETNPIYSTTYQTFSELVILLQLLLLAGALLFMGKADEKIKAKNNQFVKTVRQIGDPRKKTPKELMSFIKNVVSLIDK
jgi:hypothetical protein